MRKTLILFACAILCSSFAGAQTTGSVCDGEQGAAYGLCNAFCDAMDCDGDDPQASETACNKVQSKFEQITGHQPPCLVPAVQCPCIEGLPGWLAALSTPATSCYDDPIPSWVEVDTEDPSPALVSINRPGFIICGFLFSDSLSITEEEALACQDVLRAHAAAAGVTCTDTP